MTRISQTKKTPLILTKEPEHKAKVKRGEYANLDHRFNCKACKRSYDNKMDLTQHNALKHKQGHCIICNAQQYGDNRLNDHTKMCREKRDKKRAENDKRDKERANKNPIKPKNMYTVLMDEGTKNEEKE